MGMTPLECIVVVYGLPVFGYGTQPTRTTICFGVRGSKVHPKQIRFPCREVSSVTTRDSRVLPGRGLVNVPQILQLSECTGPSQFFIQIQLQSNLFQ